MNSFIQREYTKRRAHGWSARESLYAARIEERWQSAEAEGLVRLIFKRDDNCSVEDFMIDRESSGMTDRQWNYYLTKTARDLENVGAWGAVTQVRVAFDDRESDWATAGSIWCLFGQDAHEYEPDIKAEALEALDKILAEEAAELEKRATYAGPKEV